MDKWMMITPRREEYSLMMNPHPKLQNQTEHLYAGRKVLLR
jgi:hypothetical protein